MSLRKVRHHLTAAEEAALTADITLSRALTTKELMRKYNASRSLVDSVKRKVPREPSKQDAFNAIHDISAGATCA